MKSAFFLLTLLAAAPLWAKRADAPDQGFLMKSIDALGGAKKYARVESVEYAFTAVRETSSGPVRLNGRHLFKLHDAQGFRARLEESFAGVKRVAVVNAAGAWLWENDRPVTDPARLAEARAEAVEAAFLLFLPFDVQEATAQVVYGGSAYFEGKLMRRLDVRAQASVFGGPDAFSLFLDTATYLLEGVSWETPSPRRVRLTAHVPTNVITLALQRVSFGADARLSSFLIQRPAINQYIDENLFAPATTTP